LIYFIEFLQEKKNWKGKADFSGTRKTEKLILEEERDWK